MARDATERRLMAERDAARKSLTDLAQHRDLALADARADLAASQAREAALREALSESIDRLSESRPDQGSTSDDPRKMWFERNRSLDQSRAALAAPRDSSALDAYVMRVAEAVMVAARKP